MSQWRPSGSRTGSFGKRWTSVSSSSFGADPADHHPAARRAEVDGRDEPAGHRRKAAATPASTGMCSPVVWLRSPPVRAKTAAATCSGQDLALEQRPLGVELAELVLRDAVGPGPVGAPALGEDPRAADDAVRVDAVDPDPVLAELGGEQPDLVGLVGLGRAVGDVVRAGEERVLADDVDEVAAHRLVDQDPRRLARDEERAAGHDVVLEVPVADRRLEQRLRDRQAGVVDDEVDAAEGEHGPPEGVGDLRLVGHVGDDADRDVGAAELARRRPRRSSASMSATTTQAPSAASRWAIALPMPEPAPVTNATRAASGFGLGIRASLASSSAQYSIRNFSDSAIGRVASTAPRRRA